MLVSGVSNMEKDLWQLLCRSGRTFLHVAMRCFYQEHIIDIVYYNFNSRNQIDVDLNSKNAVCPAFKERKGTSIPYKSAKNCVTWTISFIETQTSLDQQWLQRHCGYPLAFEVLDMAAFKLIKGDHIAKCNMHATAVLSLTNVVICEVPGFMRNKRPCQQFLHI
jgi:hypothetical protein